MAQTQTAVKVKNLYKQYRIGESIRHDTLRDQLVSAVTGAFGRNHDKKSLEAQTFWALQDISFDLQQGEVLGIIGRNGAGKSTLLKILSRITKPTKGRIEIAGRVGSLLEVGTGFHAELTGRENIYMNASILGMSRQEIRRKFDEIMAFAGVEKFIDTPIKRYSSGMQMRLAFAVAAHIEPEILVVDEVLAVGDADFQRKSMNKMSDVSSEGRTVLFVSHNMRAIQQICSRVIYLDEGRIIMDGPSNEVVETYLQAAPIATDIEAIQEQIKTMPLDPNFKLLDVVIRQNEMATTSVLTNHPIEIDIKYEVLQPTYGLRVSFDVVNTDGDVIFRSFHDHKVEELTTTEAGIYTSSAIIPPNILGGKKYELRIHGSILNKGICTPELGLRIELYVSASGLINRAYKHSAFVGELVLDIPWNTTRI